MSAGELWAVGSIGREEFRMYPRHCDLQGFYERARRIFSDDHLVAVPPGYMTKIFSSLTDEKRLEEIHTMVSTWFSKGGFHHWVPSGGTFTRLY